MSDRKTYEEYNRRPDDGSLLVDVRQACIVGVAFWVRIHSIFGAHSRLSQLLLCGNSTDVLEEAEYMCDRLKGARVVV